MLRIATNVLWFRCMCNVLNQSKSHLGWRYVGPRNHFCWGLDPPGWAEIAPFPGYPSNKWLHGPIWVSTRHSTWISSTVFVGLKVVSDRQTTRRPHNIGNKFTVGRILMLCIRSGLVTDKHYNNVASWFSSVCCQNNSVHIVSWTVSHFNNSVH